MDIVVLAGGLSTERDVSFVSGGQVTRALRENGHRVIMLDVFMGYGEKEQDVTGIFDRAEQISAASGAVTADAPDLAAVKAMRSDQSDAFFGPNVIAICQQADIVFLALHGENGENGKVQAAFDLFGIRYTGSDYISSALAMNKAYTKRLFMADGIPTPNGVYLEESEAPEDIAETGLGYPCVVKPCSGGSSIGTSIAHNPEEYRQALKDAFLYDTGVIVEEYIKGREFAVGVIADHALPVIEIAPVAGFYDYKNKYKAGSTVETCPADLPDYVAAHMQAVAVNAAASLGLHTYSRMDFLLDDDGRMYCLEANTLPGMTPTSLLPQEAAAEGMDFNELCEKLIEISYQR
ncbi:MAG: D-alanine--D-alanine ligase [Lachnospiraceae bacterium]|jgi:D-alanine-D-alanine ligase|nr:D-alanine--D-alanine ligase [Lachnospiraceae bacterium]MCI1657683.1 D-alanine--D-alanine ligase [Lachnospiraceae bacterium]MCI2196099.1 D-alanine--D-alanine ligase [Lachnospiraceae bacterium]